MNQVFSFVEFYVSPLFFAIGLILLFNGIINYFIIGPNFEEGRREMGRQCFLWATLLFLIGFVIFSLAHWFLAFSTEMNDRLDASIDVDIINEEDTLQVPNVPGL
jgi:hypothetical protein